MLPVNNFSAGILAALMAIAGMFVLAPILRQVTEWLGDAVNYLVDNGLLPLTSIFIEPAKVLFLNNAINHGVLTPLGIQQAAEEGMSILFLLEANPGPGLGLLMAYPSSGAASPRRRPRCGHHPVLRRHPRDLLPVRADEAQDDPRHHRRRHDRHLPAGAVRPGLRAPAASGSIIAVYAQTPRGEFMGISVAVFGAFGLLPDWVLPLKMERGDDEGDLHQATRPWRG